MDANQHVKKILTSFIITLFLWVGDLPANTESPSKGSASPEPLRAQSSLAPVPESYRAYLWIDCGSRGAVFTKSCFTQIKLVTERMLESGEFEGIRSLSHFRWLHRNKEELRPVSMVEYPPYQNPSMLAFARSAYSQDLAQLADKEGRYALIWVSYQPGKRAGDVHPKYWREWSEMLALYEIQHSFAHELEFWAKAAGFYPYLGSLRILWDTRMNPGKSDFWDQFYRLERRLYAIDGVKILYSPRHSLRSLSAAMELDSRKEDELSALLEVWELAGEYGGGRLELSERRYDIAVFGVGKEALYHAVEELALEAKKLGVSNAQWVGSLCCAVKKE